MGEKMSSFAESARRALGDAGLQLALSNATGTFVVRRDAVASEVHNWEELRSRAHAVKHEVIEHLDRFLDEFSRNIEARAGRVYWAQDGRTACSYIAQLARERGLKHIVKSKSMATEEIGLNPALEAAGLEVVETDLGEYIIQLLNETPSHIIAPAIHKTRKDVARLFHEKLGIAYTEDIESLTAAARSELRRKFLQAEIGISGANFGIAETGAIVIVENEGNARMATSLPRIHIAVIGIEKLLPRCDDLPPFLKLLTRSATGQKISSYVSIINGVKQVPGAEGPEELHVILLDNGRTRILHDPVQRESLYCIRCAACLNVCPVYQKIGGHAYGWVYPGPIGSLITPQLVGMDRAYQLPFASSLCGACRDVCPVKINIPDLLLDARSKIIEHKAYTPPGERLGMKAYSFIMRRPQLYRIAARAARLMQRAFVREGRLRIHSLPILSAWTASREFPALAPQSFREIWAHDRGIRHGK